MIALNAEGILAFDTLGGGVLPRELTRDSS